jgi:hypothetical protein
MSGDKGNAMLRHISIRVPWHDTGWEGKVCDAPKLNGACLKLKNIALSKDENAEAAIAGKSIEHLDQKDWPPCISERATFMAPFDFYKSATHPYVATSPKTHGHFQPTPLRHPAYSAPAIPFRWMRSDEAERHYREHGMVFEPELEPELEFETGWLQDHENQKAALDCFYQQVEPETSLCFFYAKQVPFVEDVGRVRVLIGVGRFKHVGPATEYKYSETGKGKLRSILWERMVHHSIRPDFQDGFLLPYHAAVERATEDPDFDPASIAALAPSDRIDEFSFATEHVTHDGAIAGLLSLAASLANVSNIICPALGTVA